jgi:heme-degrading monooxygenase HmoA/catechol 2,3-dioxygenase-like lactoylglutathione lyase family enzyme
MSTDLLDSPVVEHAVLQVDPDLAEAYEADLHRALPLILASPGCRGARVLRVHETRGRYVLLVGWDSLEAHTEAFRSSPEFVAWRGLLHHYYDPVPVVEHATAAARGEGVHPDPLGEVYAALPERARFDHVCVAGPAMRPLLDRYVDVLGGRFLWGEVLPVGAVVVTVGYPNGHVELMAPTPGSTFLDSFLERTAGTGGLHHVTWTVPDLRAAVARFEAAGDTVFGATYDDPAWSEAFVHPRSGGVLLQLATPGPRVTATLERDLDVVLAAAGEL